MWLEYWRLRHNPFQARRPTYVPTPGHEEVLARLVHGVEQAGPLLVVQGSEGVGKSLVLHRVMATCRSPHRRFAHVTFPERADDVLHSLPRALGTRPRSGEASSTWRSFDDSLRLARLQRLQVVLVLDDAERFLEVSGGRDLDRLLRSGAERPGGLTVVLTVRDREFVPRSFRSLGAVLAPLGFTAMSGYLAAKLAAAGRTEPVFEPSALLDVYDRTQGVPLALDRVAGLSMMAGAELRVPRVGRALVAGVCDEFFPEACLPEPPPTTMTPGVAREPLGVLGSKSPD